MNSLQTVDEVTVSGGLGRTTALDAEAAGKLSTLRGFARRHPVVSFYALVFTISWGGILLLVAPGGIPGRPDDVARLFPLALAALFAGPAVAGILMTALVSGRAGLSDLLARLRRWRVPARWWAAALLIGPAMVTAVLFALARFSPVFTPGIVATEDRLGLLLFGIGWGLVGGGLLEELGWTGFAVPALRERRSAFATGLIVGTLWGAWHLLIAFWASRGLAGETSLASFIAGFLAFYFLALTAFRVLMVWVHDRTASLLIAMLMHAVLSASMIILQPLTAQGTFLWNAVLGVALWGVVGLVAVARGGGGQMLRPGLLAGVALTSVVGVACSAGTDQSTDEIEEARYSGGQIEGAPIPGEPLARARGTADALTRDLGGLVMSTLQAEGPVAAIEVCSGVAQERTAALGSEGVYVRRVSDRLRNPLNAPDAAEARELERMAALQRQGLQPEDLVRLVRLGEQRELHYMRPIVVAPPCLTCHGPKEGIDPQVRAILDDRYPADAAVGYQAGDLRGAVSVRVAIPSD